MRHILPITTILLLYIAAGFLLANDHLAGILLIFMGSMWAFYMSHIEDEREKK